MARLRAALILVDNGSYADVAVARRGADRRHQPLRHSAREALGLVRLEGRQGRRMRSKLFDQIAADEAAPRNMRQRATLMSELIRGSGDAS